MKSHTVQKLMIRIKRRVILEMKQNSLHSENHHYVNMNMNDMNRDSSPWDFHLAPEDV